MKNKVSAKVEFAPLTRERWPDLEKLFGPRGACGGCWCMVWRLSRADFVKQKGDGNKKAMRSLVRDGAEPGILAYRGGEPVGWCAVAPRADYPALDRSRVLKKVDDEPVWSVSCLLVRKDCRRQGLSVRLLREAVRFAAKRGARIVEGYPIIPRKEEVPAIFAWTGLASAFLQAGFKECARRSDSGRSCGV